MPVTIYHNPRCSKSRETLRLLKQNKVDLEIVDYLKSPPDVTQLTCILGLLGLEPRQLMRAGEAVYKDNNLGDEDLTREELISAMVEHPVLIQRPIVVAGNRACIGRPPESVLEIL